MEALGAAAAGPDQVGIGVVIPYDFALDRELWRWVPAQVSLHLTRTPYQDLPVSVAQAMAVGGREAVARCTRDLLVVEPAVVAYACTSGSFIGGLAGEAALVACMVEAGAPAAVTTSGAVIAAAHALGVNKMAVVTPYDDAVGAKLRAYLNEAGVEVTAQNDMGLTGRIWTVPYEVTAELARRTAQGDGEAVFLSCTNLRTYDLIASLEQELGVPVITSNQVTMWSVLAAAGVAAVGPGQSLLESRADPSLRALAGPDPSLRAGRP
jgi:maleate isomerase